MTATMRIHPHTVDFFDELLPGDVLECPLNPSRQKDAMAYLEQGETYSPVEPRLAATVMLVRGISESSDHPLDQKNPSLEVFMMRRARSMAFAPEVVAFPGGGVEDDDYLSDIPWVGPAPGTWATLMGCDENNARAVITTAIRELFEECGVLLAGPDEKSLAHVDGEKWSEERHQLVSHELPFGNLLDRHGLVLRADCLAVRSHWVTPPFEKRRYDTYFFSARVPEGQVPDGETTEASATQWVEPNHILERFREGEAMLVPPTISNLAALARVKKIDSAFDQVATRRVMLEPAHDTEGRYVLRCAIV